MNLWIQKVVYGYQTSRRSWHPHGSIHIIPRSGEDYQKVSSIETAVSYSSDEWPEAIVPASFNVYVAPSKLEIENLPIFRGNAEENMFESDEDDDIEYKGEDSDTEVVMPTKTAHKSTTREKDSEKEKERLEKKEQEKKKREERKKEKAQNASTLTGTAEKSRQRKKATASQKRRSRLSKPAHEWKLLVSPPEFDAEGRRKNVLHFKLFSLA